MKEMLWEGTITIRDGLYNVLGTHPISFACGIGPLGVRRNRYGTRDAIGEVWARRRGYRHEGFRLWEIKYKRPKKVKP